MSFALMFPAVSLHKSADYKQVAVRFDGNPHYGETTPTSLRKEVLRSDERHRQPTPGAEPSQSKTAHRCGHTTEHPRLVGPVRQPQGLHARQSANTHPDTGRHYHYQPKNKDSGQPLELDLTTVHKHLAGWVTIGLYAINPQSQRCKWIAIDADYDDAFFDLGKLKGELELDGVSPALEMSRRGGHLWIFASNRSWQNNAGSTSITWPSGWVCRSRAQQACGRESRS